jgi:hypothetical protein
MKFLNYKIFSLLLLGGLLMSSCKRDKIDVAALTDFPPGILRVSPGDGSKVVKGNFDVVVTFVDGTTSPLSSATVTLKDANGTELATTSRSVSGTRDSVVITGSTFNAPTLEVGFYKIEVKVTDIKNQEVSRVTMFEISNLPYAANHDEMYLAGGYNGWGADVMTLVADHIWEIKEVDLQGGEWKIKNCANWCDEDWGDPDCDGFMQSNKAPGGNANTKCGQSGLVNLRFNDQTLAYTVQPAVLFDKKLTGLYLLGTFNNFQGSQYQFNLTANNTWVLNEIELKNGAQFRFAEFPDFMGTNYGDNNGDGVAEAFGTNITFNQPSAFYSITFNDKTLAYSINFVRFPSIGIIGSATPTGWGSDTNMEDKGNGAFEIVMDFVAGEVKFRANDSWDQNWGGADFPEGIAVQNGPNIPVPAGRYKVTFNPSSGAYKFEPDAGIQSVGIIGSATPGGWGAETAMRKNGDGTYSAVLGLLDGEAKFRANNDWAINWGASGFPNGTGTQNGPNIPITKGLYLINFNPATGEYSFTPTSIGLIGSATPGGWSDDTNLTPDAVNPAIVTLTVTLTAGEAKFRANDDWKFNWGANNFPGGTGVQDGPNIPVPAGTYIVTFNVNTGAYTFN